MFVLPKNNKELDDVYDSCRKKLNELNKIYKGIPIYDRFFSFTRQICFLNSKNEKKYINIECWCGNSRARIIFYYSLIVMDTLKKGDFKELVDITTPREELTKI